MRFGIMQPYFAPYLGYFALINLVDEFILFDTPQFIRHGYIERNKILKPNNEALYVKIPLVKKSRGTKICEMEIKSDLQWQQKMLAQLVPYKKSAKNYHKVIALMESILSYRTNSIVDFNKNSLQMFCEYLNIVTPISVWSAKNIELNEISAPDEWALRICEYFGANEYYNPAGGRSFFSEKKYQDAGITLKFVEFIPVRYRQHDDEFIPNMSIIDVLMFCDESEIIEMLSSVKYV